MLAKADKGLSAICKLAMLEFILPTFLEDGDAHVRLSHAKNFSSTDFLSIKVVVGV